MFGAGTELGAAIADHPTISAVSFTGSDAAAQSLRGVAADRAIPLQLELGGKNAVVVLDDADVAQAARLIVNGAFGCTGQRCNATSRVVAVSSVVRDLAEELDRLTASLRTGNGLKQRRGRRTTS